MKFIVLFRRTIKLNKSLIGQIINPVADNELTFFTYEKKVVLYLLALIDCLADM